MHDEHRCVMNLCRRFTHKIEDKFTLERPLTHTHAHEYTRPSHETVCVIHLAKNTSPQQMAGDVTASWIGSVMRDGMRNGSSNRTSQIGSGCPEKDSDA